MHAGLVRIVAVFGHASRTLREPELLHNCIFLLKAGHETTTNLTGNGLHALLRHQDQLERLIADPALINTAVEEQLNYERPVQLNNSLALAPITLSDRELPAGTFITMGTGAANRDLAPSSGRIAWTSHPNRTTTSRSARAPTPARA